MLVLRQAQTCCYSSSKCRQHKNTALPCQLQTAPAVGGRARRVKAQQIVRAEADLQTAGDAISGLRLVFQCGVLTTYGVCIVRSLLPILDVAPASKRQSAADAEEEESVGVRWGVMSVISFLPLFDWLAWIFAAQEDAERARDYYTLAGLYAVPVITNGFQQDWFSVAAVLACVAHIQVERIVQTEPELINRGQLSSTLASALQSVRGLMGPTTAGAPASGQQERKGLGLPEDRQSVPKRSAEDSELEKWDARWRQRSKDKQ